MRIDLAAHARTRLAPLLPPAAARLPTVPRTGRAGIGPAARRAVRAVRSAAPAVVLAMAVGVIASSLAGTDPAATPVPATPVLVAARDLAPGSALAATDVVWRPLPPDALPNGALAAPPGAGGQEADLPSPAPLLQGRSVRLPIMAGEPILTSRLAPDGLTGTAAATPPDARAFSMPIDARTPPVVIGQHVELFARPTATDSWSGASGSFPAGTVPPARPDVARTVAADAVVVQIDDRQLTVAVPETDAPAVAAALLDGALVVAVTGAR